MWSIPCMERNHEKGSEEKGGLLSQKIVWECHIVKEVLQALCYTVKSPGKNSVSERIFVEWVSNEEVVLTIIGEIVCS